MTPGGTVSTLLDGAADLIAEAFRVGQSVGLDVGLVVALAHSGHDATDPATRLLLSDAMLFIRSEVVRLGDPTRSVVSWAADPQTDVTAMVDLLHRAAAHARMEE